jgi:hypothetical protein
VVWPSWLDSQKRQGRLQPVVLLLLMIVVVVGNDNTAAAAQLKIIITKYAKTNNSRIVTSYGKYSSEEESVTVTQRTMQSGSCKCK